MKKITVMDLFSGIGGLSSGFEANKNFNVVAANEILSDMAKTYSINYPSVKMYNCDIKDISMAKLKLDGINNIDIVIGGPPCQAFSTVGRRVLNDPRAILFKEYYRILQEVKPKVFLFENVCGILTFGERKLFDEIITLFLSLGYHMRYKILNAVNYGVPQERKRVILVGSKLNCNFEYPKHTHGKNLKDIITLRDAISDLPIIGNGGSGEVYLCDPESDYQKMMRRNMKKIYDHNSTKNSQHLVDIMDALPDGGTPKDIPKKLRPTSGFGNTYSRLWWDKPCTTITRNFGVPSSSRCIHPKDSRALTTREGARIQSFPDDFKFYGSRASKNLQIGNAVPPILSKELAEAVFAHIKNNYWKMSR
jgi:DNA (cytosine-5)-methyltransferase 1